MDRVWPPTIVGKRKAFFTDPYVHDPDAVTLCKSFISVHPDLVVMTSITAESVKHDECPVYVFPPSAEGFIRATYLDVAQHSEAYFPKLAAGWTLKYATVRDIAEIDPHRKLVNWAPMHTSKEINNHDVPIRMIGSPQGLSADWKKDFQAELRYMDEAESVEEIHIAEYDNFESKLTSVLFQDGLKSSIQDFFKWMTFRRNHMKKAFAFDADRVANASIKRLDSLGALVGEHEHAANVFTSRLIHRTTERELGTLDMTTDEIERATATKRQWTQLERDQLESTRVLVKKQNKQMIQRLVRYVTKFQKLMEKDMMSRVKLVTSIQQTEKEASVLQNFISSGASEIVEQANKETLEEQEQANIQALKEQEQANIQALKEQEQMNIQALKEQAEANKVALKEQEQEFIHKAKSNHKCCICYHGLEGFSIATSGNGEKRHKKACFLPCMHANVCTTCSEKRWNEGRRECPICRQPLTERPRVIYL